MTPLDGLAVAIALMNYEWCVSNCSMSKQGTKCLISAIEHQCGVSHRLPYVQHALIQSLPTLGENNMYIGIGTIILIIVLFLIFS